ncbi:vascular endothelial growth factor receptor 1 isoform X2 [Wyeomyia smithii]|uniref:vascular endothelial growth factor receptor 1 isoform X2 n=1 Tax=Wyeomyia smithii TaxID=174621 RepID=UPI00246814D3|nr:vascular endothelial growth factor receptor 1 isoform X2 [Wyeomyia smithii]
MCGKMLRRKSHNLHLRRRSMPQSSVIFLIIIVQIVTRKAQASDLEANDMYHDLIVQNGAPEILSYKPEVELDADAQFEMTCKAAEPIRWHIKRTEDESIEDPDQITITDVNTSDGNKPYGIKVVINLASAQVVGRYYCVFLSAENAHQEPDLDELEAQFKATSTYIFVKDPDSPLVPVLHTVVTATQYEDVVIPCKPSSKDVQVELVKDEQEMQIDNYKYTETVGFVLTPYRLDDSGIYLCRSKEQPDKPLHLTVEVTESCELNGTNHCKLGSVRRFNPLLLLTTGGDRNGSSSASSSSLSVNETFAPVEELWTDWNDSSLALKPLLSVLSPELTNSQTFRTAGIIRDYLLLGNASDYDTTTISTEYNYNNSRIDDDPDVMTAGGSNSSSNATTSLSSGVGPIKLTLGKVTGSGSHSLDPSVSPSLRPSRFHSSVTEYIQKPRVESKAGEYVKQGESIALTCSLDVVEGVKFDMRWVLPSKRMAQNDSRTTVSRISVIPHPNRPNYQIGTNELTIAQSLASDTGFYKCEVQDHHKHVNHRSARIVIVEQDAAFINLTEDNGLELINTTNRRPIKIVIKFSAHPTPLFHWTRDNGEEPLEAGDKYDISQDTKQVTLIIKQPSVYDTGIYSLHAENEGANATYHMKVYVREKPVLSMSPIFARPKETVTYMCSSIGYPKPNMRFMFIPCTGEPWTNCSKPIQSKNVKDFGFRVQDSGKNQEIITVEQYSFQAETAGYVACYAVNSEGQDFVKADLLISDLDEPVMITLETPKTDVTRGDLVEIVCAASVYNHTNQILFFRDDVELFEDSENGIEIKDWYETYAYRRRLTFTSVGKQHEGDIRCQANVANSDLVESKEIRLVVHEPIAPKILEGTETVELELGMGDTNQFQCSVEGMPQPTVEWLKDGIPMDFENDTRIQLINGTTVFFQFLKTEDSAEYACRVQNKIGHAEKRWNLRVKTVTIRRTWIYLVLSLLIVLFLAVILISMFYYRKKKEVTAMKEAGLANFEEGNLEQMNPEISLDEQADLLPYKTEYEFPKEKLKLGKQLGAGAFGVVMKATAQGIMVNEDETVVAVKMVKKQTDNEVMRALISELKIMVHLGQHLNVVNLLGAVTKNIAKRELMVIVEYCRFGNVQNFLLKHRPYFIDQINSDTGEIDHSIEKNQFRWSKAGYMYNSQGLKYVNLSFSTHNVNNHGVPGQNHNNNNNYERRLAANNDPMYCNYINYSNSNSANYTNPKNHLNSKGYVRHSGIQNMAMVDSCNTEATVMTSIEGEELNTNNTVNSNEPLWRSNYGMDYKGPARSVTTTDLVCWASQVACGMEYLASRKVLHGDLAARNILLCDDNVVKICDFGLARSMYKSDNYKKKGEAPLPFKWLALECISDNIFGTYSDVWAYGIVLWEFFSLAKVPYPGMEANQELYNKLRDGYRMDKPQYANQDVYDIMLNCWNVKPDSRPSFKDLKSRFNAMLPEELRNHYIDLNEPYLAMNAEKEQRGEPDYLASLGPPEEQAPSAPNYVNGIILPLPPISDNPDYLKMTNAKSDSEESQFDFASFNNSQPSPTLKNNLDNSPQQGSKRHKKKGIPEEIPMLHNHGKHGQGFNSDSETEATSPVPMVRTSKMQQPEHEYTNLKRLDRPPVGGAPDGKQQSNANDAFSNPGYVVVKTVNEKRLH